jgi:hypothetical protein
MRDNWSLPPRSWLQTVLVTGLTAIRLAIIAVLVLFVLGPMLLDLAKVKRGSPAVNFMYDGRTYVRQTAGTEIAKYIPPSSPAEVEDMDDARALVRDVALLAGTFRNAVERTSPARNDGAEFRGLGLHARRRGF